MTINMNSNQLKIIKLILKIGVFGVFFGHGMVAINGNNTWVELLKTIGFSTSSATSLLPVIGYLDIVIAVLVLFLPLKIVLIWAVIWAFSTALARPFSGYPIWAFVERFGNWAVPLALLLLQGFPKKISDLFKI